MVDIESLVIGWGNTTALLEDPFHANVPEGRPERFFTVERTGGPLERFRDLPQVAVQAWAPSRSAALRMINEFTAAAWADLLYQPRVSRIDINTIAHFPGADGEPRYQALLEIVTA